jgi:hypothetical protein
MNFDCVQQKLNMSEWRDKWFFPTKLLLIEQQLAEHLLFYRLWHKQCELFESLPCTRTMVEK